MTYFKYLMKRFLPIFFGAIGFFSLVLVLVDLLTNIFNYISFMVPPAKIFKIMVLYLPKTIWYSVPLGVLFACSYTLSDLYAKNELTAIFASGKSLLSFTLPLLVLSLLLSFGLFFFEDKVVVNTYSDKVNLQNSALGKEVTLNNQNVVVISEGGSIIYKADYYDNANQRLYGLYVVIRNEDNTLNSIIFANSAYWQDDRWNVVDSYEYEKTGNSMKLRRIVSDDVYLSEIPESFRNNEVDVETVDTKQALSYIQQLKRTGLPYGEALSVYYKKFAFPFVVFLVVFLSIGLSGKTRKNVLLVSLGLSVCAAVLFYVSQMVTMLLAKWGYISPLAGAWTPVIIFIFLSIVLLKFART